MAKLIVALLLSVGLANGLANFGGSTCELDSDYKERFEKLEDRIEEMMGVVEGMMGVVESISEDIETQAEGAYEVTYKCYGVDAAVPAGGDAACGGSVPTPKPTPKPTLGLGFTSP